MPLEAVLEGVKDFPDDDLTSFRDKLKAKKIYIVGLWRMLEVEDKKVFELGFRVFLDNKLIIPGVSLVCVCLCASV